MMINGDCGCSLNIVLASSMRFSETFDSTDLDGNGDISFTHNRGYLIPQVELVDDSGVRKDGYTVIFDTINVCTLRILGAGTFTDWRVEIL